MVAATLGREWFSGPRCSSRGVGLRSYADGPHDTPIRVRYGLKAAFEYAVGEKLLHFAEAAARHPDFAREMPRFVSRVRSMFTAEEITTHLARIQRERREAAVTDVEADDLDFEDRSWLGGALDVTSSPLSLPFWSRTSRRAKRTRAACASCWRAAARSRRSEVEDYCMLLAVTVPTAVVWVSVLRSTRRYRRPPSSTDGTSTSRRSTCWPSTSPSAATKRS